MSFLILGTPRTPWTFRTPGRERIPRISRRSGRIRTSWWARCSGKELFLYKGLTMIKKLMFKPLLCMNINWKLCDINFDSEYVYGVWWITKLKIIMDRMLDIWLRILSQVYFVHTNKKTLYIIITDHFLIKIIESLMYI